MYESSHAQVFKKDKIQEQIWRIKPINTTTWLDKWDIRAGGCFARGCWKLTFQSVSIRFCLLVNLRLCINTTLTSLHSLFTGFSIKSHLHFRYIYKTFAEIWQQLFFWQIDLLRYVSMLLCCSELCSCKWCVFCIGANYKWSISCEYGDLCGTLIAPSILFL